MIMENSVEWLAGETEVLGENLPQCRFVHHKPHMLPLREPGPPRWPDSNDVSPEAEKSPLLRAITKQRLVQTLQAGEYLACSDL
jgi:hypothetical protein